MSDLHIGIASPIETARFSSFIEGIDSLPKGMGGTAVNHLILGLLNEGLKISIYTLTPEIEKPIHYIGEKLSIFYGPYRRKARYRIADLFKKESENISAFIKTDEPDLVHAHWGYEFAKGAIKSGFPHVITLRDSPVKILWLKKDIYRLARFLLHKKVMKHGVNFLVNSPYLNTVFNSDYDIVPNPVVAYKKTKRKLVQEIRIISVLNGWGPIKNASKALEAFALVQDEIELPVKYHLIGINFGINEIAHNWAKENNADSDVVFRGQLSHEDLMEELSSATIMLHPSKEESFGNVIAEAMSVGLPVIGGKDAGAVPWLLDYGKRGVLIDVNSSVDIRDSLINLIENESFRLNLSEAGLKFAQENLGQTAIARKHLNIYNQILGK